MIPESVRSGMRRVRSLLNRRPVRLDGKGMPVGFGRLVVADEFGNPGRDPSPHENTFGYGVVELDDPSLFAALTEMDRVRLKGGEMKSSLKHMDELIANSEAVRDLGVRTRGYYIDKREPPVGWREAKGRDRMIDTAVYVLSEVIHETDGNVYFIFDHHTSYGDRLRGRIVAGSYGGRLIDGDQYDSDSGPFHEVLQSVDHISNAVRGTVEIGDPTRTDIMGTRIERIGPDKVIGRRRV